MSAVSHRRRIGRSQSRPGLPSRRKPPMLCVSMRTMAPDGSSVGALSGISDSISPSSSEVSRMFGTLPKRSQTFRLALAKTSRNQATTSVGIVGHGFIHPSLIVSLARAADQR
jgi:hypothetical protein